MVQSLILHLPGGADCDAVILRCASSLVSSLAQHAVPLAAVVECPSASDAGLFHALEPLATKNGFPLLVSQPQQLFFSLRSALAQLGLPPARALVVSLSMAPPGAALAAAAALHCATLHLEPSDDPGAAALAAMQHLAQLARGAEGCLVVGYLMKRTRQLSLMAEGMLPLLPRSGLCFVPLDPSQSLAAQQRFDILLQKPTDYMEEVAGSGAVPGFAAPMLTLRDQLAARPSVLVVDPLEAVQGVIDRTALAVLLDGVSLAAQQQGIPLRSPKWALLQRLDHGSLQVLGECGLQLPIIVKPQVACGVSEAHQMAFLLGWNGLQGLQVPLPAVAQEYIDHGGLVWKVYVAGDKVFMAQRKSTPDLLPLVHRLASLTPADAAAAAGPESGAPPSVIAFDSLKSLPTSLPWAHGPDGNRQLATPAGGAGAAGGSKQAGLLQQSTAEVLAGLLRQRLRLTLFGFDVVASNEGELVVIDVNFFPSFKGIPEAPQALREALLARHREHLAVMQAGSAGKGSE